MEINHLEELKQKFPSIKNNMIKLEGQLKRINSLQSKGYTSIELQNYKQTIDDRIVFVAAQKKTRELMQLTPFSVEQGIRAWQEHKQSLEALSERTTLTQREFNIIQIDKLYAEIQIDSYKLYDQPKNAQYYVPLIEKESSTPFKPFDITVKDHNGNNFLMWGVEQGLAICGLRYLLECGISCNDQNNYGQTVLHKAAGKPEYIKFILDKKIELYQLEKTTRDQVQIFKKAYKEYKKNVEEQYISNQMINAQDKQLETALHKACAKKCVETVTLLIEAGINLGLKNKQQKTCFDILCAQPWDEQSTLIAAELLHADQNLATDHPKLYEIITKFRKENKSVIDITHQIKNIFLEDKNKTKDKISANNSKQKEKSNNSSQNSTKKMPPQTGNIDGNKKNICSYVLSSSSKKNPIIKAMLAGRSTFIKYIKKMKSEKNESLNEKDIFGMTPLRYAADINDEKIFELLLEHGADPNGVCHEHIDMVNDTNLKKKQRFCLELKPLEFVSLGKSPHYFNFLKLLINKGASLSLATSMSPLHGVISKNDIGALVYLLKQPNIDVNCKDCLETTPLGAAVLRGNPNMVELLLDNKADPNIGVKGLSFLDLAYEKKIFSFIRHLLKYDATVCKFDIFLNGKKVMLSQRDVQESLKNSIKKYDESILLQAKNNSLYITTDPLTLFWYLLTHNSAVQLKSFLQKDKNEIARFNKPHPQHGNPLDFVYNKKKDAQLLVLLMHGMSGGKNLQETPFNVCLNEEEVSLTDEKIYNEINQGFDTYLDKLPVFLSENNSIYVSTTPHGLFWATLRHGTAQEMEKIIMLGNRKFNYNESHPTLGYPLDYVITNKKDMHLAVLLRNKIMTTKLYEISNDLETQESLKEIDMADILVKLILTKDKLPLIMLERKK